MARATWHFAVLGLLRPTVHYIELRGKDVQTGEKRYEKVVPD
jgi:hypothetical protein